MAIQTNVTFKEPPGAKDVVLAEITLDNSYPSGGYAIAPSVLKAGRIKGLGIIGVSGGYAAQYDAAVGTIRVFYPAPASGSYPSAGVEMSAGFDLTGVKVHILAFVE